jgi:hypothetical protein
MSLLIVIVIILVLCALACWAVSLLPLQPPFGSIVQCLIIVIAIVAIAQRAGLV